MRADHLHGAFHGFGAAVAEEGSLQSADLRDALRERSLVLVVVEIGRVDQ